MSKTISVLLFIFSLSAYSQTKPVNVQRPPAHNQTQEPLRRIVFALNVQKPNIPNDLRIAKAMSKKYCKDYTTALFKHLVETLAPIKAKPAEEPFIEFCQVANEIIDNQTSPQILATGLNTTQDRADFIASAEILKSIPAIIQSHTQQVANIASLQEKLAKTSQDLISLQTSIKKMDSQQGSKSLFETLGVSEKSVPFVESILIIISLLASLGMVLTRFMQ